MRYTPRQYATVLIAALKGKSGPKQKEVIRRFLFLLRKHGLWARREHIVKEVERQEFRARGLRKITVQSAAPLAAGVKREIKNTLAGKLFFEETVKPELLAGMKILVDDETLIDATGKRQVERLFAH